MMDKLKEFQEQIETAKQKLAEISAREKVLADQKATLLAELATLGVAPEKLNTTILQLEATLNDQMLAIQSTLAQLPKELLK